VTTRCGAVLCLAILACASVPPPEARRALADALAHAQGWHAHTIPGGAFELTAYLPAKPPASASLAIYIEGDGLAWLGRSLPSDDPSPLDPLALRLALAHPGGAAAYLARPCQYTRSGPCEVRYWTHARFAPEVIAATHAAITSLKRRTGARDLTLVGYSGGAAVAALVAARRRDVVRLLTVAGNLDHATWTAHHRVSPLADSLSPADEVDALRTISQWHAVGAGDTNVTPDMLRAYAERFSGDRRPVVHVEPGFDHRCCWVERWPALWHEAIARTRRSE
jgi:pimeloyl-ACP methyl ester carboxylesterase